MPRFAAIGRLLQIAVLTGLAIGAASLPAAALPSFAAQTGQPCVACHVGGFGPQLTPFGEIFKITGYTQQGGVVRLESR